MIRALLFLLQFTLIPVAMGRIITYKAKGECFENGFVRYITGLISSWGIFYVLFSLLEWFQNWNTYNEPFIGCYSALKYSYMVVSIAMVVVWLILDWKRFFGIKDFIKTFFSNLYKEIKTNRFLPIYIAFFALALLVQSYFAYKYEINEWSYDDYDYVVSSVDTINNDILSNSSIYTGDSQYMQTKRAASSWTTYIAFISDISGYDVTTVCHTILPVILMWVAYVVYFIIAQALFNKKEDVFIFMTLLSVIFIFGNHSHYALTFRMLCTIWQGKAVLFAVIVPFMYYYFMKLFDGEITNKNILPTIAISMGATSLSTMSMMIIGLLVGSIWITTSIYHKKIQSIRYLIAGLIGPVYQLIFYWLICLLLEDMQGGWPQHFNRSRGNSWWYKWFG